MKVIVLKKNGLHLIEAINILGLCPPAQLLN